MRFFLSDTRENCHVEALPLRVAIFLVSLGKNRISQGVEDWGSLISVPYQRTPWGGGKRRGVENLTNDTPPKKGFWTPPRTVRFPPPSGVSALFFLYKNPRQSRPEPLLEGSKNFRESAFSGTFSSPHTFCTPPYHGPTLGPQGIVFKTWHKLIMQSQVIKNLTVACYKSERIDYSRPDNYYITWMYSSGINYWIALHVFCVPQLISNYITRWCSHPRVVHRCMKEITLHSAAAEEIIRNYITFLDPGGINYVIIVGPTVGNFFVANRKHFGWIVPGMGVDQIVPPSIHFVLEHDLTWSAAIHNINRLGWILLCDQKSIQTD